MKKIALTTVLFFLITAAFGQADQIAIVQNKNGIKLVVEGNDFIVNGMNWDYYPIGTNYTYSLWEQSDAFIKEALASEMTLLQKMGVNAIRQYTGVPARWIEYICEEYGIYTMLNHPFGRYGANINGTWVPKTNYADVSTRNQLLAEVKELANSYKDTPGLLLYLLGNENNYGLFWEGAETEDIPEESEQKPVVARYLYTLFNEAALIMKGIDSSHPVALCNGDLQFIDIIAEVCEDVDIFGTNVYRGASFGNTFQEVKNKLNKPLLFTEFGADAWNAIDSVEDQSSQAYFMIKNWQEIYKNAAGLGKAENSIGGFTFQFSDGWWKYGQTKNLDVHDTHASWRNGGYKHDFAKGDDNMNEEWFGVCSKGIPNDQGLYQLQPRTAYYALQEVHTLNPYTQGTTLKSIKNHFSGIQHKFK